MIFLDTSFLFALISRRDAHHTRVVEVFHSFRDVRLADHLLTTNHVVAETITLTRRVGHAEAAKLGEQLYSEKLAHSLGSARRGTPGVRLFQAAPGSDL